VSFTVSSGAVTLPPDYTFQPSDRGRQTFSATLYTTGSLTLNVFDTTGAFSDSQVVQVTPGPATYFTTDAPSAVTAGAPFNVTVTAHDAYSNVVTNYAGTVTLNSNDPINPLLASHTFTPADAGVYTFFGVQLFTAGQLLLRPTDGVITSGVGLTVNPAAAATLVLSGPSAASAGTPFLVTLTAYDAYGNVATGYTGTVSFSSDDTAAGLPGNSTFQPGDQGVQSFMVTLQTPGTRRVRVTDTLTGSLTGFLDVVVS
jgi:hypothetical protein